MTKTTPHPFHEEPVVADLRPTPAGSDRVCASCGKYVEIAKVAWTHTRAPRSPHRIEVVMGKSQWDRWVKR
ncbi:MAG: hypothetical protein NUW01_00490 [Gemmatimonadaceae bacterium]|nr:hypothetical protein [Gemmatimonadaceae bacterium]